MKEPTPGLRAYLALLDRVPEVFRRAWDAIAIYDLDGRIVAGNAAARRLIGAEFADGLIGQHFSSHLRLDEATAAARLFAHVVRSGEPLSAELSFIDGDRAPIPVTALLVPARYQGEVVGVIGFARDVRVQRSVEAQFIRAEQQFRSIFESHPDAIALFDLRSRFTRINVGTERLTGYTAEELIGQTPDLLAYRRGWLDRERIVAATALGRSVEFRTVLRTKLGDRREVEGRAVPLTAEGSVRGFALIVRDVTEERRREREAGNHARRVADLYRIASTTTIGAAERIERALAGGVRELGASFAYVGRLHDGMMTVSATAGTGPLAAGRTVEAATTCARAIGVGTDPVVLDELRADSSLEAQAGMRSFAGVPLAVDGYVVAFAGFASRRRMRLGATDRDYLRALAALLASALQQQMREARLGSLAFQDPLTGLPNRTLLHDRLEQTLLAARRARRSFAVHYVVVDGFARINESYGHETGDAVLIGVGTWLRASLRASDTLARIGADEFVVVQPEIESARSAEELAARLVAIHDRPLDAGACTCPVTLSVGTAIFPADAGRPEELLRCADAALERVKADGGDGYRVETVAG